MLDFFFNIFDSIFNLILKLINFLMTCQLGGFFTKNYLYIIPNNSIFITIIESFYLNFYFSMLYYVFLLIMIIHGFIGLYNVFVDYCQKKDETPFSFVVIWLFCLYLLFYLF